MRRVASPLLVGALLLGVSGSALAALRGGPNPGVRPAALQHPGGPSGNSAGPPPETTGGFGEDTCAFCHLDFPLNEEGGEFELLGLPEDGWERGATYELVLRLSHPELGRAGFQISARFASGPEEGQQAGSFEPGPGQAVQAPSYTSTRYLNHDREGIAPTSEGERRWRFRWIAPEEGGATVVFHAAGNAANGDGAEWGDRPYSMEVRLEPAADSGSHSVSYQRRKSSAAASL